MKKLDIIYNEISKNGSSISFDSIIDLVDYDGKKNEVFKNEIYNGLLFDQRFIMTGDNQWDVSERFTLEEIKEISANALETDIDVLEAEENEITSDAEANKEVTKK